MSRYVVSGAAILVLIIQVANADNGPRNSFQANLKVAIHIDDPQGALHVLHFDDAPVNVGHAFNLQTGEYQPKEEGVYEFSVNVRSYMKEGAQLVVFLMNKDQDAIAVAAYDGQIDASKKTFQTVSFSIKRKLSPGDKVTVKTAGSGVLQGLMMGPVTWFTGSFVEEA